MRLTLLALAMDLAQPAPPPPVVDLYDLRKELGPKSLDAIKKNKGRLGSVRLRPSS